MYLFGLNHLFRGVLYLTPRSHAIGYKKPTVEKQKSGFLETKKPAF